MSQASRDDVRALRARLDLLSLRDAARLGRRLKSFRGPVSAEQMKSLAAQFDAGEKLVAARAAAVPAITYPDLPVTDRRAEIANAITDNQVVIVAGETGSGKTTQLPKICLELGRGIRGTIGHTQPRRLAARTVAQRIAERFSDPERQREIGPLDLNISGCINACGHHHVAHIGLLGVDKAGEEFYQITLGGASDGQASIGAIIGPAVSSEKVVDTIEAIIGAYIDRRIAGERFIDTYRRLGAASFKEAAYAGD